MSDSGQQRGSDPCSAYNRVPRQGPSVLLVHREAGHQEALCLGVQPSQPAEHCAVQEEADMVCGTGVGGWMVSDHCFSAYSQTSLR